MKKYFQALTCMLFAFSVAACADNGVDQSRLLSSDDYFSQYEEDFVVEFFWLGCSHCQEVEPYVIQAKEEHPDVEVVRVPVTFNERWNLDASIYYAAVEELGVDSEGLINFYKEERLISQELPTLNEIAAYVGRTGHDEKAFRDLLESEDVRTKVAQADRLTREMNVQGTPTFFVNGTQEISTQDATSYENLVERVFEGL